MIPVPMRMSNAQLRKSARVASRIDSIAPRRPCAAIPAVSASAAAFVKSRASTKATIVPMARNTTMRSRFPDSQIASATSATASAIRMTTTRSKTRTADWAVSSRSTGMSGIVPKSSKSVTPAGSRDPPDDAGRLRRCGSEARPRGR